MMKYAAAARVRIGSRISPHGQLPCLIPSSLAPTSHPHLGRPPSISPLSPPPLNPPTYHSYLSPLLILSPAASRPPLPPLLASPLLPHPRTTPSHHTPPGAPYAPLRGPIRDARLWQGHSGFSAAGGEGQPSRSGAIGTTASTPPERAGLQEAARLDLYPISKPRPIPNPDHIRNPYAYPNPNSNLFPNPNHNPCPTPSVPQT